MKRFKVIVILLIAAGYLWLTYAATTVNLPSQDHPLYFYSNQARHDLKLTFCQALKSAKASITLHMYAATDPTILKLLKKKAQEGVTVSLYYDASASPDLQADLGTKIQAQPVSSAGLMHHKIVVIDENLVLLGSANLTTQSLRMHDNLVLGIQHPGLAVFLKNCPTQSHSFEIEGQSAELWLLPDEEGLALERVLALLLTAKNKINIAMFTLTHPRLCHALIEARQRGVEICCAVDYYISQGASLKTIETLRTAGIKVISSRGQQLLHHKWAWIDEQTLVLGSANWTQSAFAKNQDCFLILPRLTTAQNKFIAKIWKTLELESN